ncbi:putative electron transfer flavoprotein subunit [Mactra antiquata]
MGKGFNNYMTKKFFHPSSKENIKRVWMARQKTEYEQKKEEEMVAQYRKEQDVYENRALLGDEKAKMGLSFMYDAPPGLKKAEKEKEEGETEYKFEWQRKYNAPREQYAKNDETIRDQPFGIEVRNVRCIKCRQWGHVNTDRICPLFGRDLTAEPPQPKTSASSLLESMREDGFTLKQSMLGKISDPKADNEQMLPSEDEDDPEVKFLKSLSSKQKKKLLKKLNRLQQKQSDGGKVDKKKKKKKEKKHKTKKEESSNDSDSDEEIPRRKKEKRKHKTSTSSEESNSDDEKKSKKQREITNSKYNTGRHGDRIQYSNSRNNPSSIDTDRSSKHDRDRESRKERHDKQPRYKSRSRSPDDRRPRYKSRSKSPDERQPRYKRSRSPDVRRPRYKSRSRSPDAIKYNESSRLHKSYNDRHDGKFDRKSSMDYNRRGENKDRKYPKVSDDDSSDSSVDKDKYKSSSNSHRQRNDRYESRKFEGNSYKDKTYQKYGARPKDSTDRKQSSKSRQSYSSDSD